jgi:uncharacterized membrane protein HdeD (DUF308 family)
MADTPLERIASKWWVQALIGVLSVAVGILALAHEGITLLALGMFALMAGFEPGAPPSDAVLRTVIGILAILAGLVLIVRPAPACSYC